MIYRWGCLFLIGLCCLIQPGIANGPVIRVGYFPNITHAQAVIGMADGSFQRALGSKCKIQSYIFNAGPSAIEAMMAGQLDLAYIGPNPAINGYIKTDGTLLRVIAGAASGGAALVLRADLGVKQVSELNGLRLASPQIGNTQDVALRYYLRENKLRLLEQGGKTQVMPIANPDQLVLFQKKEIDGAWTVEPWVSRLVSEAGGVVFTDERSLWPKGMFITGNIIVSQKYLKANPALVKAWLRAHVDLTIRINANPRIAQKQVNQEIKKITGKALPDTIISQAFTRFDLTYDPLPRTLYLSAERAYELGFLGKAKPNLAGIYDLRLLNQVLKEKQLPLISE